MDSPLFRFAVVADTHVNPVDDVSTSPWAVNRLANARTRHVFNRINAERPDFAVHLGDLVHPVPSMPGYAAAAERFHQLVEHLDVPMHLVPGNHDMGDKPADWVAAPVVTVDSRRTYRETFGEDWSSFHHAGCHFVIINAQLLNSGLPAEREQRDWLENDLARHQDARTFVFSHYPAYLARADEPEYYDNIAEPARSWLLDLFGSNAVEAVFAGHVHNFFYNRHAGTDLYVVPSTTFVRHDFTELSRVAPTADGEFGRDDRDKLGYLLVEVYGDGHVAHVVRTGGQVDDDRTPTRDRLPYVHVRRGKSAPLGLDMRLPWAEIVELPYNGLLDEFARRQVRNDYPLLALWEMGAGTLRVPLHDLQNTPTADRMRDLASVGHAFQVFHYGIPTGNALAALSTRAGLVSRIEIILPKQEMTGHYDRIDQLRKDTSIPIHLSPLETSAHAEHGENHFSHFVRHGFDPRDTSAPVDATASGADGLAFRISRDRPVWQEVRAVEELAAAAGIEATVHVCLADLPAAAGSDDLDTANRVAEALLSAWCAERCHIFLDTFADIDRGYFPRIGLTDRHYNPRLAGAVFRNLHMALRLAGQVGVGTDPIDLPGVRVCTLTADDARTFLVLPKPTFDVGQLADAIGARTSDIVNLATGALSTATDLAAIPGTTPTLLRVDAAG